MTQDRWAAIERLCQDALDRTPAERSAFLDQACGGDLKLRAEVESLLAFETSSESFIEAPPNDIAAGVMARRDGPSFDANRVTSEAASSTHRRVRSDQPQQRVKQPLFFWIALGLGIWMLGLYALGLDGIFRYGVQDTNLGWQSAVRNGQRFITTVDPNGPAAGALHPGDRIISFNNDLRFERLDPRSLTRAYPWGGSYTGVIQRGPQEQRVNLSFRPVRNLSALPRSLAYWFIGIVFVTVGLGIGLLRPDQTVPRLASLTLMVSGFLFLRTTWTVTGHFAFFPLWERYLLLPAVALRGLHLALAYHFYCRLPAEHRRNRFWSSLKYLLYGCFTLLTIAALISGASSSSGGEALLTAWFHFQSVDMRLLNVLFIAQLVAFVALCAVVIRSYRLTKPGVERRRVKLMLVGSLVALVPNVGAAACTYFGSPRSTPSTVNLIANLFTVLIPITAAYAILKHRFLDINVVIRRGLQYVFAKTTLRFLLVLPIAVLVWRVLANPNRTLVEIFGGHPLNLFLIGLATLGLLFRKPLGSWIDRLFFREAYDQEQILLGVIEEIKELDSREEIARQVSRQIEAALHPESVYIFYRDEHVSELSLGFSSNGLTPKALVPEPAALVRALDGQTSAREYPFADQTLLPSNEEYWLDDLGVELIVPLAGTDIRLRGFLFLGPKKSEQPYTVMDKRLLAAIAQQMAVMSEISTLKGRVDRGERIKHDVLLHVQGQNIELLKECPQCGACFDSQTEACAVDGQRLILTLPVERTLAERYRLDQLIGKGGMGSVYRATDLKLDRTVAIKLMIGNVFGDKSALRRFAREAQATARLNHPNVVSVFDYGTVGPNGAFLVMELIPGVSLKEELKLLGKIPPPLLADWFGQVLEG
ncbi:MAG: protein kinase, partial [Pyrinomonadaceae bacterium]